MALDASAPTEVAAPEPWSSAAGWREFFDLLTDALVVLDERARVVLANTAALRLLPCEAGMPIEQLQGHLGAAAVHWLRRAATGAGQAAPAPEARLVDGRAATLEWRRLDAHRSVLRLVPNGAAPIAPGAAAAQALAALPVGAMREAVDFLWVSPFPTTLQGPDFRFVDANPAFLAFSGFAREQLIGRDAIELQPAPDHASILATRQRLRATPAERQPEPGMAEGRLIDAGGRERRYRVARRTLVDAAGQPLYLGVLQDVTAEHVARERADRSLRELDDWFDLSPVGMVLFDERGLLLRSNPAFDALVGTVPVSLADAPAGLQALLGWGEGGHLAALEPGAPAVQQQGWVAPDGAAARPLRAALRCYRAASGQRRYMAVLEDRSAEEERDLAQMQIGALIDTAGVGLATFQDASGWVPRAHAGRADGRAASGGAALQRIGRDIVAAESMPEFERLQAALRRAERAELRYAIDHPELGRRWLLTRVEPATLASGMRTTSVVTLDITEQHETQQRTEQLLRELSTILESTSAGIAYLRGELLARCNSRFEAMLELPAGTALGQPLQALLARHEPSGRIAAEARRALDDGVVYETELALRVGASGQTRWYTLSVRRAGTPGDAPEAIAVLADITRLKLQQQELERLVDDRQRAERAVAVQADRTRAILDSVLVGIVTVGPHGIEWMNRSARRMFGGELADFVNLPIATVATPEAGHPFLRTGYLTELVEGEAETFECRVKARDGREFWVVGNVVSTARESAGRQLTYALLDIERRRQAEARMAQAQAQLQRIIEAAPLAITLRDARTLKILRLNAVAAANGRKDPQALIGLLPEQLFEPAIAAQRRADMEQALASREVTQREYRVEQDGETRVWDARYLPLADAPGAPPDQLLMVATDVTEQRAAQEARLEAAIAQREMLVKEVHHRIKNNLQGVAGLLQQIAQRKPEVAGPIAEVVGQVHAIAQVYGLQVGASGPLRLTDVVRAIAASVQRSFGRTIEFETRGASAPQWLLPEAESIPIALTLNELLTNAVKHSAATPAAALHCALACSDDEVQVTIANPGLLPTGFSLARIPGGVSGLGLVRALLPRRSASLTLAQDGAAVQATLTLRPPGVARAPSA